MSDQKLEPEVEAEIREYVRRRPISHIGIMDLIDLARDQRLKGRAERKASLVKASRVIHEREGEIAALRAQVETLTLLEDQEHDELLRLRLQVETLSYDGAALCEELVRRTRERDEACRRDVQRTDIITRMGKDLMAVEAREKAAQAEVERLTERLRMAAQHRADARLRAAKAEVDLADLRLGKEK